MDLMSGVVRDGKYKSLRKLRKESQWREHKPSVAFSHPFSSLLFATSGVEKPEKEP